MTICVCVMNGYLSLSVRRHHHSQKAFELENNLATRSTGLFYRRRGIKQGTHNEWSRHALPVCHTVTVTMAMVVVV